MKKLVIAIFAIFLLFSVASAESVTRMKYRLTYKDVYVDGYYTGEIKDGKPDGFGIFETDSPSGVSCHYMGGWKNGLMEGEGGTYWNDGSIEFGQYQNGCFISGLYNYNGLQMIKSGETGEETLNPFWIDTITHQKNKRSFSTGSFVGNRNSKVYHRYDCDSVREMKEKNKVEFSSVEEAEGEGYKACNRCNPNKLLLVDDENITVTFLGFDELQDSCFYVNLKIVNKTDKSVIVTLDDASVNDETMQLVMTGAPVTVLPAKNGEGSFAFMYQQLSIKMLSEVEEVKFRINVFDESNMDIVENTEIVEVKNLSK